MRSLANDFYKLANHVLAKPLSDGSGIVFFRVPNCYTHLLRLKPNADTSFFTEQKCFGLIELETEIRIDSPSMDDTLKQLIFLRIVVQVEGPN